MPSSLALSPAISTTAAAPSVSGDELPAVTLPVGSNAGFSAASFSSVVSARGPVVALDGEVAPGAVLEDARRDRRRSRP